MGLIQNSEQIEYWTHLKTKNTGLKVQGRQVSEIMLFELNWTILHQIIPPNWTFVFYQLHSERASIMKRTFQGCRRPTSLEPLVSQQLTRTVHLVPCSRESESELPSQLCTIVHLLWTHCRWPNCQWCVWNSKSRQRISRPTTWGTESGLCGSDNNYVDCNADDYDDDNTRRKWM